jgi:hypothetical protein
LDKAKKDAHLQKNKRKISAETYLTKITERKEKLIYLYKGELA